VENDINIGVVVNSKQAVKEIHAVKKGLEELIQTSVKANNVDMFGKNIAAPSFNTKKFDDFFAKAETMDKTVAFANMRKSILDSMGILESSSKSTFKTVGKEYDSFFNQNEKAWSRNGKIIAENFGAIETGSAKAQGKFVSFLQAGQDATVGFNGAMLSLMFGGMAMQRFAGGALTSIFETYKKLIPESDQFNVATTRLAANWEFFKFQLADAFAKSPLFQILIAAAITLLQWFKKLNPEIQSFIVIFLGITTITGAILIVIGTMSLLLASIIDVGLALGVFKLAETGVIGLNTNLGKLLDFTWSDLATSIKNVGTNFGEWLTSMNGTDIKKMLTSMGSAVSKFANTVVGGSLIIALALITAMKISEWGVEKLGLKYKDTFSTMKGTTLDAVIGIIGAFISIPSAVTAILKIIWESFKNVFTALGEGIWDWIWGGDFKKTFNDVMKSVDFAGIFAEEFKPITDLGQWGIDVKKSLNWVEPITSSADALAKLNLEQDAYIKSLNAMSTEAQIPTNISESTGRSNSTVNNTTNIIVMTPSELLASGRIDNKTYESMLDNDMYGQKLAWSG